MESTASPMLSWRCSRLMARSASSPGTAWAGRTFIAHVAACGWFAESEAASRLRGGGMPIATGAFGMNSGSAQQASAREAGLRYVTDARPGIRRVRSGPGFRYLRADGSPVADRAEVARIKRIAIPPAWRDVWICPDARGHLLATGRDARGRKQYRYHPAWRRRRDEVKYERLLDFARA